MITSVCSRIFDFVIKMLICNYFLNIALSKSCTFQGFMQVCWLSPNIMNIVYIASLFLLVLGSSQESSDTNNKFKTHTINHHTNLFLFLNLQVKTRSNRWSTQRSGSGPAVKMQRPYHHKQYGLRNSSLLYRHAAASQLVTGCRSSLERRFLCEHWTPGVMFISQVRSRVTAFSQMFTHTHTHTFEDACWFDSCHMCGQLAIKILSIICNYSTCPFDFNVCEVR